MVIVIYIIYSDQVVTNGMHAHAHTWEFRNVPFNSWNVLRFVKLVLTKIVIYLHLCLLLAVVVLVIIMSNIDMLEIACQILNNGNNWLS